MRIQNKGKYLSTTAANKTNVQYLIMAVCPAAEIPSEPILFQRNFVSRQHVCGCGQWSSLDLPFQLIQKYALIPKGGNLSSVSEKHSDWIKQELMATSFVRLMISCNLPAVLAWREVVLMICINKVHQNPVSIGLKTHVELTAEPSKQWTTIVVGFAEGG